MAEDLAIDVGIPKNSEEFQTFVSCIENILEYGCGYGDEFTEDVLEKCRNSDLDIAKQVIKELEKPRSRYRQRKLKWWQTYVPKHKRLKEQTSSKRKRNRSPERKRSLSPPQVREKKPMNLSFKPKKKPMDLSFKRKETPRRHEREPRYDEQRQSYSRYRRQMSPKYSDIPKWPSKKRRRR